MSTDGHGEIDSRRKLDLVRGPRFAPFERIDPKGYALPGLHSGGLTLIAQYPRPASWSRESDPED